MQRSIIALAASNTDTDPASPAEPPDRPGPLAVLSADLGEEECHPAAAPDPPPGVTIVTSDVE